MSVRLSFGLLAVLLLSSTVSAQLPNPALDFIFPAGGQIGTTLEVEVAGRDLDEGRQLIFSHPGLRGVQLTRPPAEFETGDRPIANRFRVSIPVNIAPGRYDVRVAGRFGISTPLSFLVTPSDELKESGDNHEPSKATSLPIDTVANGRADAGKVDLFRFSAKKDQTLIVECLAQQLESKLQPIITIWDTDGKQLARSRRLIDPVLQFVSPADGEYILGVNDHIFGGGTSHHYRVQIHGGSYLVTTEPHVVSQGATTEVGVYGYNFPDAEASSDWKLGGVALQSKSFHVFAPVQSATSPATAPAISFADGLVFHLPAFGTTANSVFLSYSDRPVTTESADNNLPSKAQTVALPCLVAGRFFPRRDQDWFQFPTQKGQTIQIRVVSNRLGQPTDPEIYVQRVTQQDGKPQVSEVSTSDDTAANDARYKQGLRPGLDLGHRDPVVSFTADADATYRVGLRDLNGSSLDDLRLTYQLIIEPQRPSFELLAWTQQQGTDDDKKIDRHAMTIRRAGRLPVIVDLVRQGGFNGLVKVSATSLPDGVVASPCVLQPGETNAVLMLSASEDAMGWSGPIEIVGESQFDGQPISRLARGVSLTSATGNIEQTRPTAQRAEQLFLSVIDQDSTPAEVDVAASSKSPVWQTARGANLSIPIRYRKHAEVKSDLPLVPVGLPGDIKAEALSLKSDAKNGELKLALTDAKVKPGTYHFFLRGKLTSAYTRNPQGIAAAEQERQAFDKVLSEIDSQRQAADERLKAAQQTVETGSQQFAELEVTQKKLEETLQLAKQQFGDVAAQLETLPDPEGKSETQATANQIVAEASSAVSRAVGEIEGAAKSAAELKVTIAAAREKIESQKAAATQAETLHKQLSEKQQRAQEFVKQLDKQLEDRKKNWGAKDVISFVNSPFITLEVLPTPIELATPGKVVVQRGQSVSVDLALTRQFGFNGEVDVLLTVPDSLKQISADAVKLPPNQQHSQLVVSVAADAPPGNHQLVIQTKLKFNNLDIQSETPLTITVQE